MLRIALGLSIIVAAYSACCRIVCAPGYVDVEGRCAACNHVARPTPPDGVDPTPWFAGGTIPWAPAYVAYFKFLDKHGDRYDQLRECGICKPPQPPPTPESCEEADLIYSHIFVELSEYDDMLWSAEYAHLWVVGDPTFGIPGWSNAPWDYVPEWYKEAVLAYLEFTSCIEEAMNALEAHQQAILDWMDDNCGLTSNTAWIPAPPAPLVVVRSAVNWDNERARECGPSVGCARTRDECPRGRVWCCDVTGCDSEYNPCDASACCKASCRPRTNTTRDISIYVPTGVRLTQCDSTSPAHHGCTAIDYDIKLWTRSAMAMIGVDPADLCRETCEYALSKSNIERGCWSMTTNGWITSEYQCHCRDGGLLLDEPPANTYSGACRPTRIQ